jgi:hypothetical protein
MVSRAYGCVVCERVCARSTQGGEGGRAGERCRSHEARYLRAETCSMDVGVSPYRRTAGAKRAVSRGEA